VRPIPEEICAGIYDRIGNRNMTPTATGDLQQSMQPALTPEMARSIASAIQAMRTNRPTDAEAICLKWLSTNPGCAQHLRLLGHALMKQDRLDEAEERIRFALSLHSEFPQLEEDLGSLLALKGRYDATIPHFEKAIRQEPTLPMPYKKLGQALIRTGCP
jgi:predicted Zn-dependent protease